MTQILLFANNAQSTLAGAITNTSLTANLVSGGGALFPAPTGSQYFTGTFTDAATGLLHEIVHVTNVTSDTITMVRAQEGTVAENWSAGDIFANLWTAGQASYMAQPSDVQAQAGNYAADSGTSGAYAVTLSPALAAYSSGITVRFKAANASAGNDTLNVNSLGAKPIYRQTVNGIIKILANDIQANADVECIYDTSLNTGNGGWQLISRTAALNPSVTILTSGTSLTYTTPTGALYLDVEMWGAGGGAGGTGDGTATAGTNGGDTTFGSLTAGGGKGSLSNSNAGGNGGTASGGDENITGQGGFSCQQITNTAIGGNGGNAPRMGGGGVGGGAAGGVGGSGVTNTGGGGAGPGSTGTASPNAGGGAGAYLRKRIFNPSATYTYSVGVGGSGGSAGGAGGLGGGGGASGRIKIIAYFQ